jgi:Rrf2 family nitric oxide-sensitive transcriptional repressor
MILNISEAANLAMHALTYMANHPDLEPATTSHVAATLSASEAHMSKVFQRLTKVGLVRSIRGPKGGFSLAKDPAEITLLDIYESIDGKLTGQDCLFGHPVCNRKYCVFGDLITNVNDQIDDHFSTTTLGDLVEE